MCWESSSSKIIFHIVIIDAEPHGEEGKIYEKIRRHLKYNHLLIPQCIGQMTGDSYLFESFKQSWNEYIRETVVNVRDVYCSMTMSKN